MELTKEQLESFNQNGFLILRNFADKTECKSILEIAQIHLKYKIEPVETEIDYKEKSQEYRTKVSNYNSIEKKKEISVRRLRQVYDRDILFKNWMENEKIRPILQQILKDDVVLTLAHHNSIMTKMPLTSKETSWHQDRRYWSFSDNNLLSVWLALDTEHHENGVLEFIPKSHLMEFSEAQFGEKEYFDIKNPLNMSLIETKQSKTLYCGDVLLFHCKLLHRANRNRTDTPKISFVYTVKGERTEALKGSRTANYSEILLK